MAVPASIQPAACDLVALERCPDCDTALRPAHVASRCHQCGFAYDADSTWLFCQGIIGTKLNGLLLAARALVGLLVTAAVWMSVGRMPGMVFGAMVLVGLATHTIAHALLKRRDGNRPMLICPGGVGVWSASTLSLRPWDSLQDVRMQVVHDGSWRLTLRGSLWRPDLGGIFGASKQQAQQLQAAIERHLRSARSEAEDEIHTTGQPMTTSTTSTRI